MRAQLTRILGRSLAIVMIVAAVLAGAGCESESRCTGTKTYVIVEEGGGSLPWPRHATEGRCGDWEVCVEGAVPRCVPWWRAILESWQFWLAALLVASIVVVRRARRQPDRPTGPDPVDRWRDRGPG